MRATMTDTFHLTPSESVRVLRHEPDAIEVEGTWGPGGSPPPKHFHPAQDERFEVLEGTLTARVDGEERELHAGDVLEIPSGAVHQMWNAADVPARATWRTSPAGRTGQWFADIHALRESAATACRARSRSAPTSPNTATCFASPARSPCSCRC
jgi:quercetin dioxygenase-like cupin family protein